MGKYLDTGELVLLQNQAFNQSQARVAFEVMVWENWKLRNQQLGEDQHTVTTAGEQRRLLSTNGTAII